jgi:hypothetical protein
MLRVFITVMCTAAFASTAACAATSASFNPDQLSDEGLSRVTDICRTVMGLSPAERLTGGVWRGQGNRLDYWTSHYRGCVTSLSDSLADMTETQAVRHADAECRTNGDAIGSPALALCVLVATRRLPPIQNDGAVAVNSSISLPATSGSFFYALPAETLQREETACAALGLEPSGAASNRCVESLRRTFFAIDNPVT